VPVLVGTTRDEATFLLRTVGRDAPEERVRALTRELFEAPTQRWGRERAAAGGRVHLFRIDHPSPDPRLGALHTINVPLLFGTFRTSEVARRFAADDECTRAVSEWMQRNWALPPRRIRRLAGAAGHWLKDHGHGSCRDDG
jgi:carboxylesterase type B